MGSLRHPKPRQARHLGSESVNEEELRKVLNKKITDFAEEHADMYYLYFQLSHGKRMVLSSERPIFVEVEQEQ